jgi:diadenosine tetraphosphate (Ap4A) HIT family hydrolase
MTTRTATPAVRHQDRCEICDRLAQCRDGTHPGLIAELDTGFAVLGDSQQFRGYSLLLCKTPATELHELPHPTRLRYLEEMSQLAEAVARAVQPHKLNYECLGNVVHHLHFHVFPRRADEPQSTLPVWVQMHKPGTPEAAACAFNPIRDRPLIDSIRTHLATIRGERQTSSNTKATPVPLAI